MKYVILTLVVYAFFWYLITVILYVNKEQAQKNEDESNEAMSELTIDELIN